MLQDAGGTGFDQPFAMNGADESVGYSKTASGQKAVLWSSSGAATVLQDIGGQGFSEALAIDASGHGVGYSDIAGGGIEAVLWSLKGKATNLGAELGSAWSDTEAVGINKVGDIIGFGDYQGEIRGFLLTPVSAAPLAATTAPELSTWAMAVIGFAGLGLAGCRRRAVVQTA